MHQPDVHLLKYLNDGLHPGDLEISNAKHAKLINKYVNIKNCDINGAMAFNSPIRLQQNATANDRKYPDWISSLSALENTLKI